MWDSAGQERYRSLIPSYVKNANAIFIIFDITERTSFDNVNTWLDFVKKHSAESTLLVLCGNKIDKPKRVVSTADATTFAKKK